MASDGAGIVSALGGGWHASKLSGSVWPLPYSSRSAWPDAPHPPAILCRRAEPRRSVGFRAVSPDSLKWFWQAARTQARERIGARGTQSDTGGARVGHGASAQVACCRHLGRAGPQFDRTGRRVSKAPAKQQRHLARSAGYSRRRDRRSDVGPAQCGARARTTKRCRNRSAYLRTLKPSQTYRRALQTMVFCTAEPKKDLLLIRRNAKWLEDDAGAARGTERRLVVSIAAAGRRRSLERPVRLAGPATRPSGRREGQREHLAAGARLLATDAEPRRLVGLRSRHARHRQHDLRRHHLGDHRLGRARTAATPRSSTAGPVLRRAESQQRGRKRHAWLERNFSVHTNPARAARARRQCCTISTAWNAPAA